MKIKEFAQCCAEITCVIIAFGVLTPIVSTDARGTIKVLQDEGYTDIEVTGWRPLMKGKDDFYSTGFSAVNKNGVRVTGAVTGGPFKGRTIRFD